MPCSGSALDGVSPRCETTSVRQDHEVSSLLLRKSRLVVRACLSRAPVKENSGRDGAACSLQSRPTRHPAIGSFIQTAAAIPSRRLDMPGAPHRCTGVRDV